MAQLVEPEAQVAVVPVAVLQFQQLLVHQILAAVVVVVVTVLLMETDLVEVQVS